MSTLLAMITMVGALAATFGIAYCFAWLCLRSLMIVMPAKEASAPPNGPRLVDPTELSQGFALGQKR